jgi:hypothetical protein
VTRQGYEDGVACGPDGTVVLFRVALAVGTLSLQPVTVGKHGKKEKKMFSGAAPEAGLVAQSQGPQSYTSFLSCLTRVSSCSYPIVCNVVQVGPHPYWSWICRVAGMGGSVHFFVGSPLGRCHLLKLSRDPGQVGGVIGDWQGKLSSCQPLTGNLTPVASAVMVSDRRFLPREDLPPSPADVGAEGGVDETVCPKVAMVTGEQGKRWVSVVRHSVGIRLDGEEDVNLCGEGGGCSYELFAVALPELQADLLVFSSSAPPTSAGMLVSRDAALPVNVNDFIRPGRTEVC